MALQSHSKYLLFFACFGVLVLGGFYILGTKEHGDAVEAAKSSIEKTAEVVEKTVNKVVAPNKNDPAVAMGFVPHKALYDVKLISTKSGSQIVNLDGQMLYEWQSSCDAWLANHQFNLFYEYADSPPMQVTSDFSTFESFDGKSLDFTSQRKRDGELFDELRGRATLGEGGAGEAVYTMPEGLSFDLKQGSLFPMQHTLNVYQAIKDGKKFYHASIFDGSDEDGPVEINAFIGKAVTPSDDIELSPGIDADLFNTKAWNVRLAFFPLINPQAAADYEMSMNFHENGVISSMVIDYEDFSVSQKLVALEKVEKGCEPTEQEASTKAPD